MAITSGFFDSVSGDRTYDADQMSTYFEGLISDGVYENVGDRFAVTSANSGMNINVGAGRAIVQSHWVKNDATTVLTLDPSDVQLNRVDAIVLRLDTNAREISLVVKKGTAVNGTPTMPAITRTATVYELYLAAVLINKGTTQPTSITDLRPSSYCGWVTGLVQQVDTSDLFTQWQTAYAAQFAAFDAYIEAKQAAFDSWFSTLTKQLTVEATITKLQNTVYTGAGDTGAALYLDEYNPDTDVLFVYVNGVYFTEGIEYEQRDISGVGHAISLLDGRTFRQNDEVTFIVLKNIPGGSVISAGTASVSTNGVASSTTGTADFEEV